jgi:hypothetical protein
MFPEDDLRLRFWAFIRDRALDSEANTDVPDTTQTLDDIEANRSAAQMIRRDLLSKEWRPFEHGNAVVYDTLQEALLAFLIYWVSREGFPYNYATWLRTVVLITADVQRNPSLLALRVEVDANGRLRGSSEGVERWTERTFAMTLDGSWDHCLSRDTFRTIRRAYNRAG